MNSSSSLVPNLFKSRKILLSILEKQNYNIDKYKNTSINEFSNLFATENMDMLLSNGDKKIYIKYTVNKKLKPSDIYETVDELYLLEEIINPRDNLIIITKGIINDTIKNIIEEVYRVDKYFVTIFNIESLLFNILEHELVPLHRVLSEEEKEIFYIEKNIQSEIQMPTISRFDPVGKIILMRPGDVCEITRASSTAINETYYRLCL